MKTHELTGHECCYPRPDEYSLPESFTVEISKDSNEGWQAAISGRLPTGESLLKNTAFGDTPVHALFMAYDLVRMLWDECDVTGQGSAIKARHCYCRNVIPTGAYPNPFVIDDPSMAQPALQCCRCEQVTALTEFSDVI